MKNMNTKEIQGEQQRRALREKLDWYTYEASEQEFDPEEVKSLVRQWNLLQENGQPEGEQGDNIEEFWEYLHKKTADAELLERTKNAETSAEPAGKRRGRGRIKRFMLPVAAVMAAALTILWGGMENANAWGQMDIITYLDKTIFREVFVVNPTLEELPPELAESYTGSFACAEEVPEEYQKYLTEFELPEGLSEYERQGIRIWVNPELSLTVSYDFSDGEVLVKVVDEMFVSTLPVNVTRGYDANVDSQEYREVDGVELDIRTKADAQGREDIVIYVTYENHRCIISGKDDKEALEALAVEFAGKMAEKEVEK